MDVGEFRKGEEVLPKSVLTKYMGSNLYIKDAFIFPEKLDWYSAVGKFILNFGTLEMNFFCFVEKHFSTEDFEKCKRLHFKDRITFVAQGLATMGFPQDRRDAFGRFSEHFEAIRELRNHVAHGHLTINFLEGVETRVTLSLPKDLDRPFDPETRNLEFSELRDGMDRLSEATELFDRFSHFGE